MNKAASNLPRILFVIDSIYILAQMDMFGL